MTRALTRLDPYWALVGAIGYTVAIGLSFGYVSASEATSALVVYLGAAVLMAPAIAVTLIARQGGRRRASDTRARNAKARARNARARALLVQELREARAKLGDVSPSAEAYAKARQAVAKAHGVERPAREDFARDVLRDLAELPVEPIEQRTELIEEGVALLLARSGLTVDEIAATLKVSVAEAARLRVRAMLRWPDRQASTPAGATESRRDIELRQQQIVRLKDDTALLLLRNGRTVRQVAAVLGLSVEHVAQLRSRRLRRLTERER